jgi:hypothetical protein
MNVITSQREQALRAFWEHYSPLIENAVAGDLAREIVGVSDVMSAREIAEHLRVLGQLDFSWHPTHDHPLGMKFLEVARRKIQEEKMAKAQPAVQVIQEAAPDPKPARKRKPSTAPRRRRAPAEDGIVTREQEEETSSQPE